ncbi:MAG: triose-phosphate isomerase [Verrucomicrobia bacterium]|nr:triose-phosphate isomerase [Verrucomicrobiota bacterium]
MYLRKKIIAANWKMNLTSSEVAPYLETFLLETKHIEGVDVVLIPSFTSIPKASELLEKNPKVRLGAQNFSFHEKGAFTGEVSAGMLRDLFVRYVLVGHSERRELFGETDHIVHQKLLTAHRHEIRPILCVGETLEERKNGKAKQVLEHQLKVALADLSHEDLADTIIAYEPIWAIGTGCTATAAEASEMHHFIREVIKELAHKEISQKIRIQYGGSVTPANARELLKSPDIDGALVGGASLDPRAFAEIVKASQG